MLGFGQDVELLAPVVPVTVPDEAELLEHAERPVDRGRHGAGVDCPAPLHERPMSRTGRPARSSAPHGNSHADRTGLTVSGGEPGG